MTRTKNDIYVALIVASVGLFFLIQAYLIESSQYDLIGPRLVPMVITGLIIGLGALQLALTIGLRDRSDGTAEISVISEGEPELPALSRQATIRMAAIIGLGFIYVWLFSATGYLISTALVLAALLVTFGTQAAGKVTVLTIGGAVAYYLIFIKLMGIHNPPGWLIDLGKFGLG